MVPECTQLSGQLSLSHYELLSLPGDEANDGH